MSDRDEISFTENDKLLSKVGNIDGFQLVFAETNDPYKLKSHIGSLFNNVSEIDISGQTINLFIANLKKHTGRVIVVNNLRSRSDDSLFITKLNQARDKIAKLPVKLIFVLPVGYIKEVVKLLPDIFSFRNLIVIYNFPQVDLLQFEQIQGFEEEITGNIPEDELSRLEREYKKTIATGDNFSLYKTIALQLIRAYAVRREIMKMEQVIDALLMKINNSSDYDETVLAVIEVLTDNYLNDLAIKYFEKTENRIQDKKVKPSLYNTIGTVFKLKGFYDVALYYFQNAYNMFKESGNKSGEGAALNNLSLIYKAQGDYKLALKYLEQNLILYKNIGDRNREGGTLNNIGQIFHALGEYEIAIKYLERSLHISQEIGDKPSEGATLNNLSQIYRVMGDSETALKYLRNSLMIWKEIGDKASEGITLNNISQILKTRGDYRSALECLEKSLEIKRITGDKRGEGTILNNLAATLHTQGNYETAIKYYMLSLKINKEISYKSGEAHTLFNLAMVYFDPKVNQPEKGKELLLQVEKINKTLKNAEIEKALKGAYKKYDIKHSNK